MAIKCTARPTTAASIRLPRIVQVKKNPAREGMLIIRAIMLPFKNNSVLEGFVGRSFVSNC